MKSRLTFSDTFEGILELVDQLRSAEGCPWDQEQTLQTLSPLLLEECYELVEAIEIESDSGRLEELGDLFLHLAFQISISEEESTFTRSDVFESALIKYIDRHPHVFAGQTINSIEELKDNWEKIKQEEKKESRKSALDGISQNLPSLSSAQKIQQKAARTGFDWDNPKEIQEKIMEEFFEFESAETFEELEEEFGDLLFTIVNMGRHSKIDPEKALRNSNRKFISRFKSMEQLATQKGKEFSDLSLKEQDNLWKQVKLQEHH